jgi:uncharacterized protein
MTSELRNLKPLRRFENSNLVRVCCRSKPALSGNKLGGYAAVFGQVADLGWRGQEIMAEGSLDRALKTSDVRALYNHDSMYVLGRQSAKTLRLSTDSSGLEYEVDLPNTSYARDLRELVERGDISGASFAFVPDLFDYDHDSGTITHTDVSQLIDVSPVTFPAYTGATTEVRSAQHPASHRRSQIIRARAQVYLRGK